VTPRGVAGGGGEARRGYDSWYAGLEAKNHLRVQVVVFSLQERAKTHPGPCAAQLSCGGGKPGVKKKKCPPKTRKFSRNRAHALWGGKKIGKVKGN